MLIKKCEKRLYNFQRAFKNMWTSFRKVKVAILIGITCSFSDSNRKSIFTKIKNIFEGFFKFYGFENLILNSKSSNFAKIQKLKILIKS